MKKCSKLIFYQSDEHYRLMTVLTVSSVTLLYMLMILPSTLSVIGHLIYDNN